MPTAPKRLPAAALALALVVLAAALTPQALADRRGRGADPAVEEILARLDRAQQQIRTLRARIVETRELAVLEKPEVLRGTLYFSRPGRVRWEYDWPERRVYVLADGELRGLIPSQKRAERLDISRRQDRIERMLALGQSAEDLRREFRIDRVEQDTTDAAADELRLVPRSRRVRRRVQELRLWVDRETGLLDRIRVVTGGGDIVTLEITEIEVNPELSASLFRLEFPRGVEVAEGLSSFGLSADGEADHRGIRR